MIRNYLKISFRNLKKDLLFSSINIFGLMTGLATFILIALYVFDEYTYDGFHQNSDSIFRLVDNVTVDGKQTKIAGAGYQLSEKVGNDLPEIRAAARLTTLGRVNVRDASSTKVFYEDFVIGNNDFLNIFSFEVLQGDRKNALNEPFSVVITEETAKKFFGTTEVLGKSLKVGPENQMYKITAVLKNFPKNSHIDLNLLMSESSVINGRVQADVQEDWTSDNFRTYLLLNENTNLASLERKINAIVSENTNENSETRKYYQLQPLKKIHFFSNDIEGDSHKKGNIFYLYTFSFLALFVLIIASINYINLTTARSTERAKEIAVRKVVGASKKGLIAQFLSEAYLFTFISMLLALAIVVLFLPSFNQFTGKVLTLDLTDYRILVGILLVLVIVGFFSGLYPALVLSSLKPLQLLKSKLSINTGNVPLRRILVVFQFTISIVMMVATLVVYLQMEYVEEKDMGFAKDQLVVVDINSEIIRSGSEAIKEEVLALAQVNDVSVSSRVPGEWKSIPKVNVASSSTGTPSKKEMFFLGVDQYFLETYKIRLINGRNFRSESVADSSSVLINETAARELGISEASDHIIQISDEENGFNLKVIGIVKDFNFQSLREPLSPMILGYEKNPIQSIDYFTLKISPNNARKTLDAMENILRKFDSNHLFEYHYLDEQWDLFYREDTIRKTIFSIVAILTIIIACLGLLGLVTFEVKQRIKEIGIRKVLGARVGHIVFLLTRNLLVPIFIAALLAFPLALLLMNNWLQDFAYRIEISWWVFALAGILAFLIALITVSFQAIKAAMVNPVKNLRTE